MNIQTTKIEGVYIIEPTKHEDHRGFFSETYNQSKMGPLQDIQFVQDNQSLSKEQYVFRGLHFQSPPFEQSKLIRVLQGSILDCILDLRPISPSYQKHLTITLSKDNHQQVFIPKGCAHGFLTLEANTEILYKVDQYYSPEHDQGINIDDPSLAFGFPVDISQFVRNPKDQQLPRLHEIQNPFA